ncbi:MAG: 50S ribosomal protein L23 [Candidatus Heimdallarchaeota archaeon]|nr:50S ribosomal protein L23 [Candidatus Heimdallarchaeota archaeon]
MKNYEVILKPVITESVYDMIEIQNKIVFEVAKDANKPRIKKAVEELYNVRVVKVNTLITPLGIKRAICTLANEYSAGDLATELNLFG